MAKKYKFKPNKALLKRVKVTGRGKVKFHHAGASHLMSGTPGSKKRQLRKAAYAKAGDVVRLERMLGTRLIPADRERPTGDEATESAKR
jgi:large subunit ribosomal protein L35